MRLLKGICINRCVDFFFQVYSAETGARYPSRTSACVQRDPPGSVSVDGRCIWKLRHPEVLRSKSAAPCKSCLAACCPEIPDKLVETLIWLKPWIPANTDVISSPWAVPSFLLG